MARRDRAQPRGRLTAKPGQGRYTSMRPSAARAPAADVISAVDGAAAQHPAASHERRDDPVVVGRSTSSSRASSPNSAARAMTSNSRGVCARSQARASSAASPEATLCKLGVTVVGVHRRRATGGASRSSGLPPAGLRSQGSAYVPASHAIGVPTTSLRETTVSVSRRRARGGMRVGRRAGASARAPPRRRAPRRSSSASWACPATSSRCTTAT